MTDLLRKLKRDIDNALPSLQALNETLGDVVARVGEVEGLENRAAAARVQLASDTSQLRETQAALDEAKATYSAIQGQLGGAATQFHELRTKLAAM
jgi:hypothetical protein